MSNQLTIKRRFNSAVETVYNAWVNPDVMTQWMGPGSVKCIKFESDFRIGGAYAIHMQTNDGVKIAYGNYKIIEQNKKLAFTWAWKNGNFKGSLVTLTFCAGKDNTTELTLEHSQLPSQEVADHHTQGWTGSLDKLEKFLLK